MSKELFCFDCNRAANTECKEKHRTSFVDPEEVESMSKEQHIRTPWNLGGSAAWSDAAKDRGPLFICDMREGTHVPVGTNQANARFIVRAVNSHEALFNAVRHALAIENSVTMGLEKELKAQAKAIYESALALAEKES